MRTVIYAIDVPFSEYVLLLSCERYREGEVDSGGDCFVIVIFEVVVWKDIGKRSAKSTSQLHF